MRYTRFAASSSPSPPSHLLRGSSLREKGRPSSVLISVAHRRYRPGPTAAWRAKAACNGQPRIGMREKGSGKGESCRAVAFSFRELFSPTPHPHHHAYSTLSQSWLSRCRLDRMVRAL
ncbi:hypothetical protein MRX96_047156 [Rhipicephalus microplus]